MRSLRNAVLVALAALAASTAAGAADHLTGLPITDPAPIVGKPYAVEGVTYTPADAPFDDVGYAGLDDGAGPGISVSHRTLPLPSYVEITALDSGRTILARVERRGPMAGKQLVALSVAGFAQLGVDPTRSLAVRVRRVNPQEYERALLRTNQRAPERLVTPGPLVEVLRTLLARKSAPVPVAVSDPGVGESVAVASVTPQKRRSIKPAPVKPTPARAAPAKTVRAEAPLSKAAVAPVSGSYSVLVASFAIRFNADVTAKKLGGKVFGSGKLWRVLIGPFAQHTAAEAALARAKKAGFGDARIASAGQ